VSTQTALQDPRVPRSPTRAGGKPSQRPVHAPRRAGGVTRAGGAKVSAGVREAFVTSFVEEDGKPIPLVRKNRGKAKCRDSRVCDQSGHRCRCLGITRASLFRLSGEWCFCLSLSLSLSRAGGLVMRLKENRCGVRL